MTKSDRYPDARPATEAELDYLCSDCGCSMRDHNDEYSSCRCGCAGAWFMPRDRAS